MKLKAIYIVLNEKGDCDIGDAIYYKRTLVMIHIYMFYFITNQSPSL